MDYKQQEEYLENVQALVGLYLPKLDSAAANEITSLIKHGEPAEGVCSFAWAIANQDMKVPADVITKIKVYTEGLVLSESLPSNLDKLIQ